MFSNDLQQYAKKVWQIQFKWMNSVLICTQAANRVYNTTMIFNYCPQRLFQVHDSRLRVKMILLIYPNMISSMSGSTCFVFPRVSLDCGSPLTARDVIRECVCGAGEPHDRWILQCSREKDHTYHSNAAKLTSIPITFLYFVTLSCFPYIRHSLFFHFSLLHWSVQLYWPTLPQRTRARDCDTHFHASMINTEGRLFIMLISILQWPPHYTRTHSSFKHPNTVRLCSYMKKWIN